MNKLPVYFLSLFFINFSFPAKKVLEDYSKIGVEGQTTAEVNFPNINRNSNFLNEQSYRFTLTPNFSFWPLKDHPRWGLSGLTVSYIGIYDFYFGTKESGPVISRLQSPFLYLFTEHEIHHNLNLQTNIGIGHSSNGQYITSQNSKEKFEESFSDSIHGYTGDSTHLKYYEYNLEDYSSMGWNFYFIEIISKLPKIFTTNAFLILKIKSKWFFTHGKFDPTSSKLEDNIFYDEKLSGKTSIREFDGFSYSANWIGDSRHINFWKKYYLIYDPSFSIGLRHGYLNSEFKPTFTAKMYYKILGSLPLYYEYRNGYGRDLSNYPYKFSSHAIGIGFGSL